MISRLCQACQAHLSAPLPGVVSWALQGKKGHICSAKHFLSSLTFTSKNFWAFVGSVRGYLLQLCRWAQCLCGNNLVRILSPSLLSPLNYMRSWTKSAHNELPHPSPDSVCVLGPTHANDDNLELVKPDAVTGDITWIFIPNNQM